MNDTSDVTRNSHLRKVLLWRGAKKGSGSKSEWTLIVQRGVKRCTRVCGYKGETRGKRSQTHGVFVKVRGWF